MNLSIFFKGLAPALIIFVAVCAALFAWGHYSYESTEKPAYEVLQQLADDIQVRQYGKQTLITAQSDTDNSAFGYLGGYIFGNNKKGQEIAMTAPVVTQQKDGVIEMSFILPDDVNIKNAPQPNSERVLISEIGEKKYAVIQFSGSSNQKVVQTKQIRLMAAMQQAGLKAAAKPLLWRYNDPWTPLPMRTNEIAIELQ